MNGWVGGLVSGWMNACGRKQVLDLELQHLVIFFKGPGNAERTGNGCRALNFHLSRDCRANSVSQPCFLLEA